MNKDLVLKLAKVAIVPLLWINAKHFTVYNEETLVGLAFVFFILFIHRYSGKTITGALDERGEAIKSELQTIGIGRLHSLEEVSGEYQKLVGVDKGVASVMRFTQGELREALPRGASGFKTLIKQKIEHQLNTISFSKLPIQQKVQEVMAQDFLGSVCVNFERTLKENRYMPFDRLVRVGISMVPVR